MRGIGALLCVVAACGDDGGGGDGGDAGRLDGGNDAARPDTGPPPDAGLPCVVALPVDLLWVIDNSGSMREEQGNLAANFPALVEVLTAPPDDDGDGEPDFPPVEDLRAGVVTTDLGVGPHTVTACTATGDDGVLVSTPRASDPACAGIMLDPPWASYMAGDDATAFGRTFSCLARLGTGGCGLEQQLEASLRALTTQTAAGAPNEGFVREDSLLALVIVTDEEDCSAPDPAIFDPSAAAMTRFGPYGTRCADHPEALQPVDRYVSGLAALRTGMRARNLVVAAIAGVPRDLVDVPALIDYGELLADPRMQYQHDPADMSRLSAACEVPGIGRADPARRIVEVVRPFGERGDGIVQSICSEDLRPAIEAIARVIGDRLCGPII